MTNTVVPLTTAVDGYFAMWNERDPSRRLTLIEEVWTPDAAYVEPLMAVEGYEAIANGVAAMQAQFPEHSIRPLGEVQTHHNRVRWQWELLAPDGHTVLAAGTNVGVLAPDGRLQSVTGFFDHTAGIA